MKGLWVLTIAELLLFGAIAFGVNWMAYEQRRANGGIFVPFPTPQTYRVEPPSPPPSINGQTIS